MATFSRRRALALAPAAAGALGIAAAGCGIGQPSAQSQGPVTVHALLDPSLITLFGDTSPTLNLFKQAYPNVTLDLEAGPGPTDGNLGMINKFKAKVAAGDPLDVYGNAASDTVPGFGKSGLLKDLNPMMAKQRAVAIKDYWPAVMGTITYGGKLYGLPYEVFTELIYYNEDLLRREGQPIPTKDWTWDRLLEVCKAVTRPGPDGKTSQFGIIFGLGNFRGLGLPIMWADGGKLFNDDANPKSLSLDPVGANALQWLGDFYSKHKVIATMADATAAGLANPNAMLAGGQVAFNFSSLLWRGYRQHTFKGDVVMLPRGKQRNAASTWASTLTMPVTAKQPDAALSLLTHISGPVGQKAMIPFVDQFPSVESLANSPDWLKFDRFSRGVAIDMIKQAKPSPPTPAWMDINSQVLSPLFADVTNGRKTAMTALQEHKAKVDDLLRTQG
jgi:multiple sugar transport system substrate-binding protein